MPKKRKMSKKEEVFELIVRQTKIQSLILAILSTFTQIAKFGDDLKKWEFIFLKIVL